MKKIIGFILWLIFGLSFGSTNSFAAENQEFKKQTRFLMDTYVTITVNNQNKKAQTALNNAFERMKQVEDKFQISNPQSPLHAFNYNNTPITDPEIIAVIKQALNVYQQSNGAFDITAFPLSQIWGFYGDAPHLPNDNEIKAVLPLINADSLELKNDTLTKQNPKIMLDLGGIAKGYAISQAKKSLIESGITNAIIDAGGDVYALGTKNNQYWKVGIKHPRQDGLLGYLEIKDLAVMGSGDYERFFMENDKRYHHIFDPKTGYPAQKVSSVTVIHPDPVLADAWATALFVLGPEKAKTISDKIADLKMIMVLTNGKIITSNNITDDIKPISN